MRCHQWSLVVELVAVVNCDCVVVVIIAADIKSKKHSYLKDRLYRFTSECNSAT